MRSLLLIVFLLIPLLAKANAVPLASTLKGTPASVVVLDLQTGRTLASVRPDRTSPPGSLLKPLFLSEALKAQAVLPSTRVYCRRDLQIEGRNLPCTHPQNDVAFSAQDALAYSCNRYFASLADRLSPAAATAILEHYGLHAITPQTPAAKELLVLGLEGITVTPTQVALAYRKLAQQWQAPVRDGLKDSVRFGMAHNAEVAGIEIAGKTGTVLGGGWFAGISGDTVIAIFLPHGNGADAARLAQQLLAPAKLESARTLTVELWSTRSLTHLTAIPMSHPNAPIEISMNKPVHLNGLYRIDDVTAAGSWDIQPQHGSLRVLLTVPSEDYVIAALNGEAAPDEPLESLKALAITLRTFALVNADRHRSEGFGLCDSTHCQALRWQKPRPEVLLAVHETAGETLWSGGQRAHVYYTQHCGGQSEQASTVWPREQAAYLGSHPDPFCVRRAPAQWKATIPLAQLNQIFLKEGWRVPATIEGLRIVERSSSGRAQLLEVTGRGATARISASSFRFAVDRALGWNQVRSDWYDLSTSGPNLEINGRGFGHGVGLCQAGAYQMAVEGNSANNILKFYFPGTLPAVSPGDQGWKRYAGSGWTLLTTTPPAALVKEANAAWSHARSLWGSSPEPPVVQQFPTTELFRQTTSQPGWMLASTQGNRVYLQPEEILEGHGGTAPVLLHEFLHVLVEQQAGEKAPLWLREGLVELLADGNPGKPAAGLPEEVNAALTRSESAEASRRAHQAAAAMTARLRDRYGMPALKEFLRNGLSPDALKALAP